MKELVIVTQTDSVEVGDPTTTADNWMDDCAWATLACAANFLTGSAFTSKDGIAWGEKVGRHDRDGAPDPTTLEQLIKAAPFAGIHGRYAKSWDEITHELSTGSVIGINVSQANNYPAIRLSNWHVKREKRKPNHPYGHMTCATAHESGAQWADPTMSGVNNERVAIPVTLDQLKQIAQSKGGSPESHCLIFSLKPVEAPKKPVAAQKVAKKVPTPVAPKKPVKKA